MKKLLLILLFVPFATIGQSSIENLRASSEECKSIFVDSVNSFYNKMNFLCNISQDYLEQNKKISFTEVFNPPRFFQCYLVEENMARSCFQEQINIHIRQNFRYPEIAQEIGIQGRVYSNFIITECGNIKDIKLRGPNEILEEETRRIISLMPKLLPGQLEDGTPVSVLFSIPVTFRLD